MPNESANKFYLEQHARQFTKWTVPYSQLDKYQAQDDLARRRNVPAGFFRDTAQYLASIRAGGNGNRNVQALRRATAHGLTAQGFNHGQLMAALNASSAEVDALLQSPPMHDTHLGRELAYDAGELSPGAGEALNRSPYSDGFRTAIPSRPQAIHRRK
jgi:hypothetical protein